METRQMYNQLATTIIGICLFLGAVIAWVVREWHIDHQIDEFDRIMQEWKERK